MALTSKTFLFEKEIEWEKVGSGVDRQIMAYNEDLMVVKVRFSSGAIGAPHTHIHSQASYVASGKFEFTVEGETKTITTGDCVFISPKALHGCKCIEEGILIDTFSPLRSDFLESNP